MTTLEGKGILTICLVTNDVQTVASVKRACPPPNEIHMFGHEGLVNEHHTISDHGRKIVETASDADVVLIDWAFEQAPAINTLCFHIRRELLAPVLIISRDGPETMTACLAAGADDAVSLPIYLPYIQAKILSYRRLVNAVMFADPVRTPGHPVHQAAPDLVFGSLRLNHRTHRFFVAEQEIELTPREFALLHYLLVNPDQVCSRTEILDAVWGITFDTGTNMVDVYMHYLRRKLESRGLGGMIETVRGLGYRLILPESETSS